MVRRLNELALVAGGMNEARTRDYAAQKALRTCPKGGTDDVYTETAFFMKGKSWIHLATEGSDARRSVYMYLGLDVSPS